MEEKEVKVEQPASQETVSKEDFDKVVADYRRVVAAYNEALALIGNEYAEKVSRAIFEKIEKGN